MPSNVLTISAQAVARSFTVDPELRLPERPYFPKEILVLPFRNGGILFEGVRGSQVLQGRSAREIVPAILPHLDGKHDLAAISAELPDIPTDSIRMVIALLFSRGLLEDGCGEDLTAQDSELESFVGRYTDVTRINRNRHEALARLTNSQVVLAGPQPLVDTMAEALSRSCIGAVRIISDPLDLTGEVDLLVAASDDRNWFERAHDLGVPALHLLTSRNYAEIGPLFIPQKSACYSCFRRRRPTSVEGEENDQEFWAGIAALNVFHLLSRVGTPALYNQCHVYRRSLHGAVYEREHIARLPGCSRCGLGMLPVAGTKQVEDVWIFHNATISPPLRFVNPRDHQHHYDAANLRITGTLAEPYYGARIVPLPKASEVPLPPSWCKTNGGSPHPINLDLLAATLRYAVGYQQVDGMTKRHIAPTAGSLASPEGFLICRDVPTLPAGIYRYNAPNHELEYLGATADDVLGNALGVSAEELPEVLIVGVASLEKMRSKYSNASFRLFNLDAGFACCYFREVLTTYGLAVPEFSNGRDKVLSRLLHVPTSGNRNVVTYVLGVTTKRETPNRSLPVQAAHIVDALIERSSIVPLPSAARPTPAKPGRDGVAWLSEDLGTLLRSRRSIRDFARRGIPGVHLEAIVGLAYEAHRSRVASGGLPVSAQLWLGVQEPSDDLPAGIHKWNATGCTLDPVRIGVEDGEFAGITLQPSLSRASAILFVSMDFGDAVTHYGARGYREMLSHAGTVAAKALMVGASLGVSGCPWGGVVEDAWGEVLDIDRYSNCPLMGVSLGYSAP